MALHKHVKYKDKYGHLIEATFNLKKSTVKVVSQGIYEREYTDLEWRERVSTMNFMKQSSLLIVVIYQWRIR